MVLLARTGGPVLLIVEEVHRRSGSRELGLFAGAAVLCCPVLVGTFGFAVRRSRDGAAMHGRIRRVVPRVAAAVLARILLSAAIMGSMVQVKYTGLVFVAVWGIFLAVDLLRKSGWRIALRWSLAAGASLAAAALPWYVYVYLGTGNPFYPYLHRWFPSPYWADGFSLQQVFEASSCRPESPARRHFPGRPLTTRSRFVEGYNGILGFWVLALRRAGFWHGGAGRATRGQSLFAERPGSTSHNGECPLRRRRCRPTGTWRLSALR